MGLFILRWHQYIYPQALFQRPEEAPAICRAANVRGELWKVFEKVGKPLGFI
jgi:hypothetical protein